MTTLAELLKEQAALEAKATPGLVEADPGACIVTIEALPHPKGMFRKQIAEFGLRGTDIELYVHLRNSAAQIRADVLKMKDALEYYSIFCKPGCNPCGHLKARTTLNELGFTHD